MQHKKKMKRKLTTCTIKINNLNEKAETTISGVVVQ